MDQFFLSPIIVCGYNNGILLKINFRNIIIRRPIIYFISRYLNMLLGGADPLPQSPVFFIVFANYYSPRDSALTN